MKLPIPDARHRTRLGGLIRPDCLMRVGLFGLLWLLNACGASRADALECSYVVTNEWNSGLTAEIRLTNTGSSSVTGWNLTWQFNQNRVSGSWNANLSGANPYSASALDWNKTLAVGQQIAVGLQVEKNGAGAEQPQFLSGCDSIAGSSSVASSSSSSLFSVVSSSQSSAALSSSSSLVAVSSSSTQASSTSAAVAVNLVAQPGDASVALSWTISGEINMLEVYRDTDSNPSGRTRIASLATSARSFTASGLSNGVSYWFWIKARALDGSTINSAATQALAQAASSSVSSQSTSSASSQSTNSASSQSTSSASSVSSAASSSASSVAAACALPKADNVWAGSTCSTPPNTSCVAGSWVVPKDGGETGAPLRLESDHFAIYWPDGTNITQAQAQTAATTLEMIWDSYFGAPIFFPEPYCDSAQKYKAAVHFSNDFPLWGGGWSRNGINYMGMWIGPGAAADQWGLAHEFMHGVQAMTQGFPDCGGVGCWIYESHANWMPHQIFNTNVHCSEMLANSPHLYYGNTRDRYCNWQFFEFLKDKYCPAVVNNMWAYQAPAGQRDPWQKLMLSQNWNIEQLNDRFGEWAMHNVTWDYINPDGSDQGAIYRSNYGDLDADAGSYTQRRLRLTQLEALDSNWAQNRRFSSPYYWAPQRWGYNLIELFPDSGASAVRVKFRGVTQSGANSGWRWGLVSANSSMTQARYTELQRGSDGELSMCITPGEKVFLVVVATPTQYQKITWDNPGDGQAYNSIYRYPYMLELEGAWPQGFKGGQRDACPAGTQRHSNGDGCAPAGTPASVYVGPYAKILGGSVTGSTRIEDQATIVNGSVSGGRVGALTLLGVTANPHHGASSFSVSGSANVLDVFYPLGWFGSGQSVSGTATLLGDLEFIAGSKSANTFYGFVPDDWNGVSSAPELTLAPPYSWRP